MLLSLDDSDTIFRFSCSSLLLLRLLLLCLLLYSQSPTLRLPCLHCPNASTLRLTLGFFFPFFSALYDNRDTSRLRPEYFEVCLEALKATGLDWIVS
jgi:hypothetical protein